MRKFKLFIFFLIIAIGKVAAVDVPSEIEFAGIKLKLTDEVRRLLKADIEMLTKSPKGLQTKVDRANLYFPLIERAFKEEGLPEEFKFLALQESALVPDAISSSNAVGYWQFKKETAQEVGLRVDHELDERMNIVSASRGAARYLKRNNGTLDNWVYALLSYNLGLGGVKSRVEDKYIGTKHMTVDKDMHWYVIRFLAHKLAFQDLVGRDFNPSLLLIGYDNCNGKSLRDIAQETEVDIQNLQIYNKWILKSKIPTDKSYTVILPLTPLHKEELVKRGVIGDGAIQPVIASNSRKEKSDNGHKKEKKRRESNVAIPSHDVPIFTSVNRVKAIKAKEGDTPQKIAIRANIATEDFLRYNDLKSFETVVPGKTYFLQPKRRKAILLFYTVKEGESIKDVSQQMGIKINAIRTKNRMSKSESLQAGRVLWLRKKRPKDTPIEIEKLPIPEVQDSKLTQTQNYNKAPNTVPTGNPVFHLVAAGETLFSITRLYNVDIDSIKTWNHLSDNNIKPGLNLMVGNNGPSVHVKSSEIISSENIVKPVEPTIIADSTAKDGLFHAVQAGETLYGISKKYSTTVDSIRSWNGMSDNNLKLGSRILVKKLNSVKAEETVDHWVLQGETLYQISRKYNVKVDEILKWNNKIDAKVAVGEKLVIRKIQ